MLDKIINLIASIAVTPLQLPLSTPFTVTADSSSSFNLKDI